MMLRYMAEFKAADKIEQALLYTLDHGITTQDVPSPKKTVSTSEYTDIIINNLGKSSTAWPQRPYQKLKVPVIANRPDIVVSQDRKTVGIDVFIESQSCGEELGKALTNLITGSPVELKSISNRGVMVYPSAGIQPDVVDLWYARFMLRDQQSSLTYKQIIELLQTISHNHPWVHIELLNVFDGKLGFTKAQGEN